MLGATLVLKPLLLPLVLVPLFARAWRPLLGIAAGSGALLAVTLFTVPGSGQLSAVVRRLAGGSVLTGSRACNNLSLAGLDRRHRTMDAAGHLGVHPETPCLAPVGFQA